MKSLAYATNGPASDIVAIGCTACSQPYVSAKGRPLAIRHAYGVPRGPNTVASLVASNRREPCGRQAPGGASRPQLGSEPTVVAGEVVTVSKSRTNVVIVEPSERSHATVARPPVSMARPGMSTSGGATGERSAIARAGCAPPP